MQTLITIPQIAHENLLSQTKVRDIIARYELQPVEKVKHVVNGFSGYPYSIEEINKALKNFTKDRERPKSVLRQMSHEQICKVLRNHLKSYLWNRKVNEWNFQDWKEFNKLKDLNHAELQPT